MNRAIKNAVRGKPSRHEMAPGKAKKGPGVQNIDGRALTRRGDADMPTPRFEGKSVIVSRYKPTIS